MTRWSLGVLVGLPIVAVVALILLALIAFGVRTRMTASDPFELSDGALVAGGAAGALVLLLAVTGFVMWPWDARFHQWRTVTGVVEQTSSRLITDGKAVSQRIVVSIAGYPYGCDDTRCTLLQPGDRVSLTCKPEYQWAGQSGEACEFVGSSRTGDLPGGAR